MAKVMISMADDLLAELDASARARAMSRSALLAQAVRHELARPTPEAMAEAVAWSEARFRRSGSFDAAAAIRAERDRDERR